MSDDDERFDEVILPAMREISLVFYVEHMTDSQTEKLAGILIRLADVVELVTRYRETYGDER